MSLLPTPQPLVYFQYRIEPHVQCNRGLTMRASLRTAVPACMADAGTDIEPHPCAPRVRLLPALLFPSSACSSGPQPLHSLSYFCLPAQKLNKQSIRHQSIHRPIARFVTTSCRACRSRFAIDVWREQPWKGFQICTHALHHVRLHVRTGAHAQERKHSL